MDHTGKQPKEGEGGGEKRTERDLIPAYGTERATNGPAPKIDRHTDNTPQNNSKPHRTPNQHATKRKGGFWVVDRTEEGFLGGGNEGDLGGVPKSCITQKPKPKLNATRRLLRGGTTDRNAGGARAITDHRSQKAQDPGQSQKPPQITITRPKPRSKPKPRG